MSGSVEEQDRPVLIPGSACFATVLLHGCRFKAHRRPSHPYDILTEGGGGMHVATVEGHLDEITTENAACLAASPEMLTALVDLVNARACGADLPWATAQNAILAGFGAPALGDRFVSRHVERSAERAVSPGSTWRVMRLGFCPSRRVMVRLAGVSDESIELEYSFDDLRLRFVAEDA